MDTNIFEKIKQETNFDYDNFEVIKFNHYCFSNHLKPYLNDQDIYSAVLRRGNEPSPIGYLSLIGEELLEYEFYTYHNEIILSFEDYFDELNTKNIKEFMNIIKLIYNKIKNELIKYPENRFLIREILQIGKNKNDVTCGRVRFYNLTNTELDLKYLPSVTGGGWEILN